MGIDIYLRWKGQTEAEKQAQYTGFSTIAGRTGYLREAYHGGPYATRVLVPEGFGEVCEAEGLTPEILKERLPRVLLAALCRDLMLYQGGKNPADWGEFSDMKALAPRIWGALKRAQHQPNDFENDIPEPIMATARVQLALGLRLGWWPDFAQSFVDFVALFEEKHGAGLEPVIEVSA